MRALILAVALVSTVACEGASSSAQTRGERAEQHDTRGTIRAIADDRRSVTIAHEDIPGFMPAMTMPFSVDDPAMLQSLAVGDAVELTFANKPGGGFRIVRIRKR